MLAVRKVFLLRFINVSFPRTRTCNINKGVIQNGPYHPFINEPSLNERVHGKVGAELLVSNVIQLYNQTVLKSRWCYNFQELDGVVVLDYQMP